MLFEVFFYNMGAQIASLSLPSAPRSGDFVALNGLVWLVRDVLWVVSGQTKINVSVEPLSFAGNLPQY